MIDDRGRAVNPAGGGMFYGPTPYRTYDGPTVSSAATNDGHQLIAGPTPTPPAPDFLTGIFRRLFGLAKWAPEPGMMDGKHPVTDAGSSDATGRWGGGPRVDLRAQRAGQDGQDPTIATVSAWQDDDELAYVSPPGDEELHEGPTPFRIQRPWVPGLTAWAGLSESGFTQNAYRLRIRPMMKSSNYAQTMAGRARNTSLNASTSTNASRRRIPAVRVPTAPLSGG